MPHPLTPAKPKTMPTYLGQVFERIMGEHKATYLYCDREDVPNSEERLYCFIVFNGGGWHHRTRLTEAEIKAYGLTERRRGLDAQQMNILAHLAFRRWEEAEYRAMGVWDKLVKERTQ